MNIYLFLTLFSRLVHSWILPVCWQARGMFYGFSEKGTRTSQLCTKASVSGWVVHAMIQQIDIDGYPAIRFVTHWKRNDQVKIYRSSFKGYTIYQYRNFKPIRPDWGWPNAHVSYHNNEFVETYEKKTPGYDWYTIANTKTVKKDSFHHVLLAKFPKEAWPTGSTMAAYFVHTLYDGLNDKNRDTFWETSLQNSFGIPQTSKWGRDTVAWGSSMGGQYAYWTGKSCQMAGDIDLVDIIWRKNEFHIFWVSGAGIQTSTDHVGQDVQIRILPNLNVQDTETDEESRVEEVQLRTVDGKPSLEIRFPIRSQSFTLSLF